MRMDGNGPGDDKAMSKPIDVRSRPPTFRLHRPFAANLSIFFFFYPWTNSTPSTRPSSLNSIINEGDYIQIISGAQSISVTMDSSRDLVLLSFDLCSWNYYYYVELTRLFQMVFIHEFSILGRINENSISKRIIFRFQGAIHLSRLVPRFNDSRRGFIITFFVSLVFLFLNNPSRNACCSWNYYYHYHIEFSKLF